jgi:serine/threonine protein phosphatase 1
MNNLRSYFKYREYIFVHSGIPPCNLNDDIENLSLEKLLFNRSEFINARGLFQKKYKIVFGHTAFPYPFVDDYKIGIDTGAVYNKNAKLTAFNVENNLFLNSAGETTKVERHIF